MLSIMAQAIYSDFLAKRPFDPHAMAVNEWIEIAKEIRSLNTVESKRCNARIQNALVHKRLIDDNTFVDLLKNESVESHPHKEPMKNEDLREKIAAVQHDLIWAHWTQWQFSVCTKNEDGSLTIPASLVERWTRQMNTPYSELPESERESDRHQADKVLQVISDDDQ